MLLFSCNYLLILTIAETVSMLKAAHLVNHFHNQLLINLVIFALFLLLHGVRNELENGSTILNIGKKLKNSSNVNATWKEFKREFLNYEIASGINVSAITLNLFMRMN